MTSFKSDAEQKALDSAKKKDDTKMPKVQPELEQALQNSQSKNKQKSETAQKVKTQPEVEVGDKKSSHNQDLQNVLDKDVSPPNVSEDLKSQVSKELKAQNPDINNAEDQQSKISPSQEKENSNKLAKETEDNPEQTEQSNKQPIKQQNGGGGSKNEKKNETEKMQTRSCRPSIIIPGTSLHVSKKRSPLDDTSQMQGDSDMQDEETDRLSMQSEDEKQRKLRKKVKPRNPMPNLMNKKKPKVVPYQRTEINTQGIRLDKLSFGTLRRYQYFFKLDKMTGKPFITDKEQLLELVEDHFMNQLQVDPVNLFYRFLSTKKDPEEEKSFIPRMPNTRRNVRNDS